MNTHTPHTELKEFEKGLQEMDPIVHTCNELQSFVSGIILYIRSRANEINNASELINSLSIAVDQIDPAKEYHTDNKTHQKIFTAAKEKTFIIITQR